MGFGDVTLMAMIGGFMGWQIAVLSFFLSSFFGLGHAGWKLLVYLKKRILGAQLSSMDREMPLGPYLSMAAATLFLTWHWVWQHYAKGFFGTLYVLFWWIFNVDVNFP
jgi:leader peptidase (prepilin peptidase)/N-methyltransferase